MSTRLQWAFLLNCQELQWSFNEVSKEFPGSFTKILVVPIGSFFFFVS